MKKVLCAAAVCLVFASCGSNSGTDSPTDSASVKMDTAFNGNTGTSGATGTMNTTDTSAMGGGQ